MIAPDPVVLLYLSLADAMGYDSTSNLSPEEWAADLVKRATPVAQPLTPEQARQCIAEANDSDEPVAFALVRIVERAHKIGGEA